MKIQLSGGLEVCLLPSYKLGALCSAQEVLRNSCTSASGTLGQAGSASGTLGRAGDGRAKDARPSNGTAWRGWVYLGIILCSSCNLDSTLNEDGASNDEGTSQFRDTLSNDENRLEAEVQEEAITPYTNYTKYDSVFHWQQEVLDHGSVRAYENLRVSFMDLPSSGFLFYAMTMANKYNYPQAYTDVYRIFIEANSCGYSNPNCLDKRSRELALEYLKQGETHGDVEAKNMLESIQMKLDKDRHPIPD